MTCFQLNQEIIYQEAVDNFYRNHKSTTDIMLMLEEGKGNPDGWKNLPRVTWTAETTEAVQPKLKPAPKFGRKLDI